MHLSLVTSAATITNMAKTLFEKIAAREIPSQIVYEDDLSIILQVKE